jgi:hypothetical protein
MDEIIELWESLVAASEKKGEKLQEYGVSDEGQDLVIRMVERVPKFRPDVEVLKGDECFDYLEYVRKNEPCE